MDLLKKIVNFYFESEKPPQEPLLKKVETRFEFRKHGKNLDDFKEKFPKVLNHEAQTLRTIGFKILDDLFQVSELQLPNENAAPNIKSLVDSGRSKHGIPSFGQHPPSDTDKVVFLVRSTRITFAWSNHDMLMPIVGSCFFEKGKEINDFPGPKFPMTHLIYGVGSEMNTGSKHKLNEDITLSFNAEFKQASWFCQKAYHRIVLPEMALPDFLSLKFSVSEPGEIDSDPFVITDICIELQEFVSVHEEGHFFKDVRSTLLVKKAPFEMMYLSEGALEIPSHLFATNLPDIGPSFFVEDLTRSYGLNITVKVNYKDCPYICATAFMELNVAKEQKEEFDMLEIDELSYYGWDFFSTVRYFQAPSGGKSEDEQFLKLPVARPRKHLEGLYQLKAENQEQLLSSRVRQLTRITKKPVSGGDATNSNKPYASRCLLVEDEIVQAVDLDYRPVRAMRDQVFFIGDDCVPLSIRFTATKHGRFKQSHGWSGEAIAVPGMHLSELVDVTLMLPLSSEDLVEDIQFKHMKVYFKTVKAGQVWKAGLLFEEHNFLPFKVSDFKEAVPGDPSACAVTLSKAVLKGKIPESLEPSSWNVCHFLEVHFSVNDKDDERGWGQQIFIALELQKETDPTLKLQLERGHCPETARGMWDFGC
ncbi:hypothetical protein C7M61_003792 [Candidozyma pseudohaemuli]|uniref:Uncharacterized protein n=1 Tax=Candidozyma pseudohaemuli TaxID=418784 RepID=A0A2P7YLU0_9ASCO|nr:hypothetical protein C7M61_003792 [[Candida] pseudohaemulonii]PSK36927.1 hypothetical protein C7M61_003792 [[Candida] pseudohaemulonii]